MCHLVVQDKLAEQHILGNTVSAIFLATMDLVNSKNFKVVITKL